MKYVLPALAGILVASCGMLPQREPTAAVAPEREAAFVATVEQAGCRVDPASHEFVHAAGFSDEELRAIGVELVGSQRAELGPDGGLILLTPNCL